MFDWGHLDKRGRLQGPEGAKSTREFEAFVPVQSALFAVGLRQLSPSTMPSGSEQVLESGKFEPLIGFNTAPLLALDAARQ